MCREHDHHRVDSREMLGLAAFALARPAAANDRARLTAAGTKLMPAVPVGEAQSGGENRGVVGIEQSEECEGSARVGCRLRHRRREARRAVVETQEQGRIVDLVPEESAVAVERRKAVEPPQPARRRVACQFGDPLGLAAQQIGAVEPRAGKEGFRRQCRRCAWRGQARRRGGRASVAPPRRCDRAAATIHQHRSRFR